MVITIVGGGATALSFLYNYLLLLPAENVATMTVYLVEKRGQYGAGAAYAPDVASNILNTKTGYITPFYDRPSDFFNWLTINQSAWRLRFPDFILEHDGYEPRPLFGIYLRRKMAWVVKQALVKNVRIIQVDAEVKDITMVGSNYVTKTGCSLTLTSDYVFLCCGTLPAKQSAEANNSVLTSPYPINELPHKIVPDARVAIAGARLSCIDAVIGLIENGHKGPIAIHSRSGHFPSVRGTQGRITPKVLTANHLEALVDTKGKLTLRDISELITQEISLQSDIVASGVAFVPPLPPADLAVYLEQEIALAQYPRIWQAVLYSTNGIIDKLWASLNDADKTELLSKHFSAFMSYRVSIPEKNARKILSYLKSGQLSFVAGAFTVAVGTGGKPMVTMHNTVAPAEYDFVINATGSPRSVRDIDSDLLANLLHRGTVIPHQFGGIVVDPETYQVVSASGRNSQLYAMGELTTGIFFFTSALDINARHARCCATMFVESLQERTVATLSIKQG